MTDDAMRPALAHLAARLAEVERRSGGAVSAAEVADAAQLSLRIAPDLAALLPIDVPIEPNTATTGGAIDVLWLGPDEWLLVGVAPVEEHEATIGGALADRHHALVDVGANRAVIELRGPGRVPLLASGCPIDLDPRTWVAGRCAQTLFGRAPVLLHERNDATRLFVRPSFGGYVVDLLLDAAATTRRV